MDSRLSLTISITPDELARALVKGVLVVPLTRAAGFTASDTGGEALDEATVARICGAYGPEALGANLLWEVAQAGDGGAGASELKEALGLTGSKALAGVFSGLGKTLAREIPGREHLFIDREWQRDAGEYRYRMTDEVRRIVTRIFG